MIRKFHLSVLMLCFSLGGLAAEKFEITNCESLLHIGSLDSFELTANGIECARLLWDALKSNDRQKAEIAIRLYNKIIPFSAQVFIISLLQTETCTSPICAFCKSNIQSLDWPIPPPIVSGSSLFKIIL